MPSPRIHLHEELDEFPRDVPRDAVDVHVTPSSDHVDQLKCKARYIEVLVRIDRLNR